MKKHLIFIYGSLRRGSAGAMSVRFPSAKFVAEANAGGRLYDFGPYPGLRLDNSGSFVVGEVYEVDDKTLNLLDEFEASSHYERTQFEVYVHRKKRCCWTYEPDPEFYSLHQPISSGDWIKHAEMKTDLET